MIHAFPNTKAAFISFKAHQETKLQQEFESGENVRQTEAFKGCKVLLGVETATLQIQIVKNRRFGPKKILIKVKNIPETGFLVE